MRTVLMVRSKQAMRMPSSAEIHETLTVWIISGIGEVVHCRKRQKSRSMRDKMRLLQNRHDSPDFVTMAYRHRPVLVIIRDSSGVPIRRARLPCAARGACGRLDRAAFYAGGSI